MVLKGQSCSLNHEQINPILCFPFPKTIKQLPAFLGITEFCRIWIPRYAALARPLFMLLLILLFGPCITNAPSKFISQQVQKTKFQLLVKEYSPLLMHEPSIQFYQSPLEATQVNTRAECPCTPLPLLPHCQQEVAR
jgi:hypothetical protein